MVGVSFFQGCGQKSALMAIRNFLGPTGRSELSLPITKNIFEVMLFSGGKVVQKVLFVDRHFAIGHYKLFQRLGKSLSTFVVKSANSVCVSLNARFLRSHGADHFVELIERSNADVVKAANFIVEMEDFLFSIKCDCIHFLRMKLVVTSGTKNEDGQRCSQKVTYFTSLNNFVVFLSRVQSVQIDRKEFSKKIEWLNNFAVICDEAFNAIGAKMPDCPALMAYSGQHGTSRLLGDTPRCDATSRSEALSIGVVNYTKHFIEFDFAVFIRLEGFDFLTYIVAWSFPFLKGGGNGYFGCWAILFRSSPPKPCHEAHRNYFSLIQLYSTTPQNHSTYSLSSQTIRTRGRGFLVAHSHTGRGVVVRKLCPSDLSVGRGAGTLSRPAPAMGVAA